MLSIPFVIFFVIFFVIALVITPVVPIALIVALGGIVVPITAVIPPILIFCTIEGQMQVLGASIGYEGYQAALHVLSCCFQDGYCDTAAEHHSSTYLCPCHGRSLPRQCSLLLTKHNLIKLL